MKRNYLDQFYTIDEETGDYIVEISIEDYNDIFNNWDSSVYNVRDLDSSLKSFLEACSFDIDLKHNIVLRFVMNSQQKDTESEQKIEKGIRGYFRYYLYFLRKIVNKKRKKAFIYMVVSVILISLTYIFKISMDINVFRNIILQGLSVGGWVFLWEAFSLLFIQHGDTNKKRKEYKRLLESPIEFRYL